jgi:hypothetical protein
MRSKAVLALALAGTSMVLAQDDSRSIPVAPQPALWTPLTIKQNFGYGFNRVFGPGRLLLFGIEAAMDQERQVPRRWGQGMTWYGARYADRFGRAVIRENMASGVRVLTGEDPRYELCNETGIWKRSKHAITSAFVVRGRNGRPMPAYSRFVSYYATSLIAEQWRPESFHASYLLSAGTSGIGVAVGANVAAEFWPDIRRRFFRH